MPNTIIRRGTCAELPGVDLCVMRVEQVGDELWAQLLVTYGPHQKVATVHANDPLDLPDGLRLTVTGIEPAAAGDEALVHVLQEWTGPTRPK